MSGNSPAEAQYLRGYFDYAASTPPRAEALRTYTEVAGHCFANPSSRHRSGMRARDALEGARARLKGLLGAEPETRLILTSGGTEANNLVLHSVLGGGPREARVLMANDVHPSAWQVGRRYAGRMDLLKVDGQGRVCLADLARQLTPQHGLVSVVHGNNETGVVQDLAGIATRCADRGVLLHVDGVQAVGHLPLELGDLAGVCYTFSAHKFGGLRGAGGVITGSPGGLTPLLVGGAQESGLRAGTEDPAALAAAATALELSLRELPAQRDLLRGFVARISEQVLQRLPAVRVNSREDGLPGILSISVPGLNASLAIAEMAMYGFDLSGGSACHAGSAEPSRVIRALGRTRREALGTLRISMGHATTEKDVDAMIETLLAVVERGLEVS